MYLPLDLIKQVDSVPYENDGSAYSLTVGQCFSFKSHDGVTLGQVLPFVADQMKLHSNVFEYSAADKTVSLAKSLDTFDKRNAAIAQVVTQWKKDNRFEVLNGWRNELYVVYNPTKVPYLLVERSASCLFGVITYGVHINGYCTDENGYPDRIWVPRRSQTKPTYPGFLDNTVAGGIGYPHGVLETAIKECQEEAGLEEPFVNSSLKAAGVVSYMFQAKPDITSEIGVYQPEVEYIYDIEIPTSISPHPVDGEVASFELLTINEVKQRLVEGQFKYNCALVLIDFLIRHAFITPDNESDYLEICQRCHRKLPYPTR